MAKAAARVKVTEAPTATKVDRPTPAGPPSRPASPRTSVLVGSLALVAIILGVVGIGIGVYVFNNLNDAGDASVADQVEIGKTMVLSGALLVASGVGTLGLDRLARRGP